MEMNNGSKSRFTTNISSESLVWRSYNFIPGDFNTISSAINVMFSE